jgi:hypothetical protein
MIRLSLLPLLFVFSLFLVQPAPDTDLSLDEIWEALSARCGEAFSGEVTNVPPGGTQIDIRSNIVVHFAYCTDEVIRVPFHVELLDGTWNRSRTWTFFRHNHSIELRHDHRIEDGSEDEVTWYGGFSHQNVTSEKVEFVSLERTAAAGVMSGWRVEIDPDVHYTYGTIRQGEWQYRLQFDLTTPIDVPELPWGYETLPSGMTGN